MNKKNRMFQMQENAEGTELIREQTESDSLSSLVDPFLELLSPAKVKLFEISYNQTRRMNRTFSSDDFTGDSEDEILKGMVSITNDFLRICSSQMIGKTILFFKDENKGIDLSNYFEQKYYYTGYKRAVRKEDSKILDQLLSPVSSLYLDEERHETILVNEILEKLLADIEFLITYMKINSLREWMMMIKKSCGSLHHRMIDVKDRSEIREYGKRIIEYIKQLTIIRKKLFYYYVTEVAQKEFEEIHQRLLEVIYVKQDGISYWNLEFMRSLTETIGFSFVVIEKNEYNYMLGTLINSIEKSGISRRCPSDFYEICEYVKHSSNGRIERINVANACLVCDWLLEKRNSVDLAVSFIYEFFDEKCCIYDNERIEFVKEKKNYIGEYFSPYQI